MQVSNSTGRNTDYRVGASGSSGSNACFATSSGVATSSTTSPISGLLIPGDTELCLSSWPCTVEFMIDGLVVASQVFTEDPGLVALIETNGQYTLSITPSMVDASVAA